MKYLDASSLIALLLIAGAGIVATAVVLTVNSPPASTANQDARSAECSRKAVEYAIDPSATFRPTGDEMEQRRVQFMKWCMAIKLEPAESATTPEQKRRRDSIECGALAMAETEMTFGRQVDRAYARCMRMRSWVLDEKRHPRD
jgi:hypothetical protein